MARTLHKLTALAVSRKVEPGYYGDGGGLWLQVSKSGSKSWIFRYTLHGHSRAMGLGATHTVSLANARQHALSSRQLLLQGIDPIDAHRAKISASRLQAARSLTFDECAGAYIQAHKASWKNAKHALQWQSTLNSYASPVFGSLSVADVDTMLVMKCLETIWHEKAETASRLRGRIESVLAWATVRGYREGENPARWRGHLDQLLPSRAKIQKVNHHPALPFREIEPFIKLLRQQESMAAQALEFAILTAARTGEVLGAKWDEIDVAMNMWTVPAHRMKAGKVHRVPLCERAKAILLEAKKLHGTFVFPGQKDDKPLSNMALLMLLRRLGRQDLTTHGFRSTFRDWAAEMTSYPREVAEMALAHTVGDAVEAAYRRGDLFEKRTRMMSDWCSFCEQPMPQGNLTSLRVGLIND
ncbi:integrase [Silvimonas terrae]|uniref:Integrase n=1 Tax=Silvimonas terrae TaxID=300266 RepID=A0A840RB76_9NEIS|nr:site-specific integrase [Silvimonas terrae]MBB5189600.1 integrase [Silvimonas terrae]